MPRVKPPKSEDTQDRDFLNHLKALGLSTADEYLRWCADHGFSRRIRKHWTVRCKERYQASKAEANRRLQQRQQETRNPLDILLGICNGDLRQDRVTQPHLERVCQGIQQRQPWIRTGALRQLILHAHATRAEFFSGDAAHPALGPSPGNTFLEALSLVSGEEKCWLRQVETWRPRSHNAQRQFASLLRHLLVRHEMPRFFDVAWFSPWDPPHALHREWYLRVAAGESMRRCDLPIPYTKRMGHYFMRAPDKLTVAQALRWGQVRGMGGDERLARAVLETRLAESLKHEDFWRTVIAWFIEHPSIPPVHVGPIVDYLHHQRFVPQHVCVGPAGRDTAAPPQPRLSMKGRTPDSLLKQVNAWHGRLGRDNTHQLRQWQPSGINEFDFLEGSIDGDNLKCWTIRELMSTKSLIAEGKDLKHCVASYAPACARGDFTIWTLELETSSGRTKLLTIQVRKQSRQIIQARGSRNRLPTEKERAIVVRWAAESGLKIDC